MNLISYKNSWNILEQKFLERFDISNLNNKDLLNLRKFLYSHGPKIIYINESELENFLNLNFIYHLSGVRIVLTSKITKIAARALYDLANGRKNYVVFN